MSRRKRRHKGAARSGWGSRAAVTILIVAVVGSGILYALIGRYLHSDGFRQLLSAEVSKAAKVDGSFDRFRWHGLAVDTERFKAKGPGLVRALNAEGIHTEIGLSGITRGVWEIRNSTVRRLEIDLDTRQATPPPAASPTPSRPAKKSGWLPTDFELQGIDLREIIVRATLDDGPLTASGMQLSAQSVGSGRNPAYLATIDGGSIRLPWSLAPLVQLDRARARYQDRQIFLTDADARVFAGGRINATGEWNLDSGQFAFEGDARNLLCEDLLNETWAKRLTGTVSSSFTLDRLTEKPVARGKLTIQNAVLTALPILDTLAAYADTRRFRVLNLNEARTDWRWSKGEITLTNLVLSSESLVHLEGTLIIRGDQLDGRFRLGLAPGTLATIPGAETDVFLSGERGLLWTPLHVTGTLDDPKEDLTGRLIDAAGMRMFDVIPETGERVLKFTRNMLDGTAPKAIDTGIRVIEQSTDIIRETGGILGNILGGGTPPPPPPPPPPVPDNR